MVSSKTHARLGVSAAAIVLACTMSAILVRSGRGNLAPAVRLDLAEAALTTPQPRPLLESAPPLQPFLPDSMLVATPMHERLPH